jgi:hypothetical protein
MSPALLAFIVDGSYRETIHACFAAAIKHSRLLGDFLDSVVRREYTSGGRELDPYHWRSYLDACKMVDPNMSDWSPASSTRIKTAVMSILREAGIIDHGNPARIIPSAYEQSIIKILEQDQEYRCLRCMRYDQ